MPGPVFSRGDRVELRTYEEADLGLLETVYGDPATRQRMGVHTPYSERTAREWLESLDEEHLGLVLCERSDDERTDPDGLGYLTLFDVDDGAGTAELGAVLVPDAWGRGLGTAGCSLLLDYAFDERRLHRVRATTLAVNESARRALDRVGFTHEGTTREAALVEGERVDELRYGLLATEWRARDTDAERS